MITINDNIITDDPNVAFELGKLISKTDGEVADETRRVHETHARLVIEKVIGEEASKESGRKLAHRVIGRRRTCRSRGSSEGAGITPEVPDEPKSSFVAKAKHDVVIDWGSEEESNRSDENVDDIPWVSTSDEEEKGDDDDDRSIDIEETDDERTNSDNGDQAMTDMKKNVAEKTEELQGDEEKAEEAQDDDDQDQKDKADDDIIRTLFTMSQKEKPEVLKSSSSHSLSSNYGNQFLNLSSDASLVGTIKETTDAEINYLLDVQIQQEIPSVLSAPLFDVLVSVIPPLTTTTTTPLTTTPIPTPPIINKDEDPSAGSDQGKKKRKQGDKFESSKKSSTSKESTKGKTLPKTSKTRKSVHAKDIVEEATHEVAMDVEEPTQENAKNNADQPQIKDALKTSKIPNKDWFKQPPRPPTPDPE
ncbi:hypothetical protein Tco_0277886 [Tanacetum coccineum]